MKEHKFILTFLTLLCLISPCFSQDNECNLIENIRKSAAFKLNKTFLSLCNKSDETESPAFFCRHYCPFSFYSVPLFLRGREKEGMDGNGDKKCTEFRFI